MQTQDSPVNCETMPLINQFYALFARIGPLSRTANRGSLPGDMDAMLFVLAASAENKKRRLWTHRNCTV